MKMTNPIFIDRVPKKIDIAIFKECGRLYAPRSKRNGHFSCAWIAADLKGYHVTQGVTPTDAIESLFLLLEAMEDMAKEESLKGKVVRTNGRKLAEDHIEDMRKRAKWMLVGVDWRDWMIDQAKKYK